MVSWVFLKVTIQYMMQETQLPANGFELATLYSSRWYLTSLTSYWMVTILIQHDNPLKVCTVYKWRIEVSGWVILCSDHSALETILQFKCVNKKNEVCDGPKT